MSLSGEPELTSRGNLVWDRPETMLYSNLCGPGRSEGGERDVVGKWDSRSGVPQGVPGDGESRLMSGQA